MFGTRHLREAISWSESSKVSSDRPFHGASAMCGIFQVVPLPSRRARNATLRASRGFS